MRIARPLAASIVLACAAAAPSTAEAYKIGGDRWPGTTITFANAAPRYAKAVTSATRAWNRARIGIRFKRAPRSVAQVLIRYGGRGGGATGCEGIAGQTPALGYPSPFITQVPVYVAANCPRPAIRRLVVAHELGHVLGLAHYDRRCALMNSVGNPRTGLGTRCPRRGRRMRRLQRKLVGRDDRKGARKLYRRPPPRYDKYAAFFPEDGFSIPASGPVRVEFSAVFRHPAWRYRWDFGDPGSGAGNRAEGPQPVHTYAAPGRYSVALTVSLGSYVFGTQRHTLDFGA